MYLPNKKVEKNCLQQGIGKKGAEVQASTFVILFGFGAKSELTFFKCPFFANTQTVSGYCIWT